MFHDRNRCRRWHCETCRWCWSDVLLYRNRCGMQYRSVSNVCRDSNRCRRWSDVLHHMS